MRIHQRVDAFAEMDDQCSVAEGFDAGG